MEYRLCTSAALHYSVLVKGKVPELDGIRGIAILLVLICHISLWEPFTQAARSVLFRGTIGVDLFFVLSGFLITGILINSKQRDSALWTFYLRRILRIWPVYFVALFTLFFLLRRFLPSWATPWRYIFFVQNLSSYQGDGPLLHPFWSLAVEEQFYLIWPWIVLRLSPKHLARLCAALFLSALGFRIAFALLGVSQQIVYVNTLCRTDAIALGSLLAVWVRSDRPLPRVRPLTAGILAGGLVVSLIAESHKLAEHSLRFACLLLRQFGNSFAALLFACLLLCAWQQRGSQTLLARALRNRFLTYTGQISFTLYIINLPIYTFTHGNAVNSLFGAGRHPAVAGLLSTILATCVSFSIALCSWKFFERPILSLKDRIARPKLVPALVPAGD